MDKISRQLRIYNYLISRHFHGPKEFEKDFGIGLRMLQRDLKDLRDAGVINVKYDKKEDNYVYVNDGRFDGSAPTRRKEHLIRLHRLAGLIANLTETDIEELEHYESAVEEYYYAIELFSEIPEGETEDERSEREDLLAFTLEEGPPEKPELADLKAEYYALFPDSYERKRQRDFKALSDAGFELKYDRKYRAYIFTTG
ncbi:MAG: hypothetical protein K6F54_00375 [Lachnospiraceae bacterium]|nr:hypothetical protein [Lachnospiraceae bacterium]